MDQEQIVECCREIWRNTLGLDLNAPGGADANAPSTSPDEARLAAYVKISGDWKGAVLLECPESVTRHASAMLFEVDADEMPKQEMQDAVDELVRMLGKSLQQIIAPAGKTSSPRPTEEGLETPALSGMRGVLELDMSCEGRPIRVSVLESVPVPAATS